MTQNKMEVSLMIITTWKTFLLYGLDLMTKEECSATTFFIATNEIRYDVSGYSNDGPISMCKTLWPDDLDNYLKSPEVTYREFLDNFSSSPMRNLNQMMMCELCLPSILFVPNVKRNTDLVHVLQKYLNEVYGIGSIWLDGLLYEGNGNEYSSDKIKCRDVLRRSFKEANKLRNQSRSPKGSLYRDTRLNTLQQMSESEMRTYLHKNYDIDTAGMDATKVYALMTDLFVDENGSESSSNIRTAIQERYNKEKKRRKKEKQSKHSK